MLTCVVNLVCHKYQVNYGKKQPSFSGHVGELAVSNLTLLFSCFLMQQRLHFILGEIQRNMNWSYLFNT